MPSMLSHLKTSSRLIQTVMLWIQHKCDNPFLEQWNSMKQKGYDKTS